jgi:hypothetical protein
MTSINSLLFPLAVCTALLVPEYELWCLDDCWSDMWDDAFSLPAISCSDERPVALDERTCRLCSIVPPGEDDDSGDE